MSKSLLYLDDYRRVPRLLTQHEKAMIEHNDARLAAIPRKQVLGVLINQLQHECNVALRPLRSATIIQLKQEKRLWK